MGSDRNSANSGSYTLKTSGFSESIAQPATNSEQYDVNIAGRDSIDSNSSRRHEMCGMSQFQGHHSTARCLAADAATAAWLNSKCNRSGNGLMESPVAADQRPSHVSSSRMQCAKTCSERTAPKMADRTDNSSCGFERPKNAKRVRPSSEGRVEYATLRASRQRGNPDTTSLRHTPSPVRG